MTGRQETEYSRLNRKHHNFEEDRPNRREESLLNVNSTSQDDLEQLVPSYSRRLAVLDLFANLNTPYERQGRVH